MPGWVSFVGLIELKVLCVAWVQVASLTVIQLRCYGHSVDDSRRSYQGVIMQLDALLYISGGGIDLVSVPPGINPPYRINVGIGVMVTVPWGMTNQQHEVDIELVSEDGQPVQVPVGPDLIQPVSAKLTFNVGRPPGISIGDDQHICLAANMPGLPIPAFGKYEFILRIDGHDERRLAYRVKPMVGTQMTIGPVTPGPSQLPS